MDKNFLFKLFVISGDTLTDGYLFVLRIFLEDLRVGLKFEKICWMTLKGFDFAKKPKFRNHLLHFSMALSNPLKVQILVRKEFTYFRKRKSKRISFFQKKMF